MLIGKWMLIMFISLHHVSVVDRNYFNSQAECLAAQEALAKAETVQGRKVFKAFCEEAYEGTDVLP